MKTTPTLNGGIYGARPQKINKHIEIVSSTVSGLSSMSKRSRDEIYNVLSRHYKKVDITIVNSLEDLEKLVDKRPNLVFLGMKFVGLDQDNPRGQSRIWLSDYLEDHDIAHTGSGYQAHHLELNKSFAKQRMLDVGLKTSPFYVVKQSLPKAEHTSISFPLFVKPADRGGGLGIDSGSLARNSAVLQKKIDAITNELQADSLVEEYLPGREYSVAILKKEFSNQYTVMPIELIAQTGEPSASILSQEVKKSNTEVVSEVMDNAISGKVCQLALAAFHALGGRDYGRIDIRLDANGDPNFLEANLMPSLIDGYGSFPKACRLNINLNHEDMLLTIVALGLKRESVQPGIILLGVKTDETLSINLAGIAPIS